MRPKKDAYLPGLRVTGETAGRKRRAIEMLGVDVPSFSRFLVEDFIRIAESGEKPAMPPRLLTIREEMILMEVNARKSKNGTWRGSDEARLAATRLNHHDLVLSGFHNDHQPGKRKRSCHQQKITRLNFSGLHYLVGSLVSLRKKIRQVNN
jgi:hypothetical protein